MTTPPPRVYLEGMEICDFRGFPESQALQLGGQHLLLYGENGSGKTSIFQAIFQLLQVSPDATPFNNDLTDVRCLKNRFTDETRTDGHITLRFRPGEGVAAIGDLRWSINTPRPDSHDLFTPMARTRGCLDYRAVLRTSFLHESKQGINLFSLLVTTLLRDIEMPTGAVSPPTFGVEWDAIETQGNEYLDALGKDPSFIDDAEIAKYAGDEEDEQTKEEIWQQYLDAQLALLQDRVEQFNSSFSSRIGEIETIANKFIEQFDKALVIRLIYAETLKAPTLDMEESWTQSPRLWLIAIYGGVEINHPALVLNEARLTAIALAIYLAALKVETPESAGATIAFPRLLILDDVLIGLDMGNRLPVLELIEREFANHDSGWQVFLMTFDRAWYELAKQRLPNGQWKFAELYSVRIENYEKPILIKDQDHLERALEFLLQGEVKAAAAHVRTEFELILKKACADFRIPVRYELNPSKVAASDFWNALKSEPFYFEPAPHYVRRGKDNYVEQPTNKQEIRYLQRELITKIEHSLSWVLNRLVHSDFANSYRSEVEAAIFDVEHLRRHLQEVKSGKFKELCYARELILRILSTEKKKMEDKENKRKKLKRARR